MSSSANRCPQSHHKRQTCGRCLAVTATAASSPSSQRRCRQRASARQMSRQLAAASVAGWVHSAAGWVHSAAGWVHSAASAAGWLHRLVLQAARTSCYSFRHSLLQTGLQAGLQAWRSRRSDADDASSLHIPISQAQIASQRTKQLSARTHTQMAPTTSPPPARRAASHRRQPAPSLPPAHPRWTQSTGPLQSTGPRGPSR